MTGSLKPHILPSISACISSSLSEPTSYAQAIKDLRWQRAMSDEYNALIQNNTWKLVPPPPDANIIGLDYNQTFAPVIKLSTVRLNDDEIIVLLIYMDDIVVFGSSKNLNHQFVSSMHSEFSMKDLGPLRYFLGVELVPNSDGLLLLQCKYINDILTRFDLAQTKPVLTLLHSKMGWNSVESQLLDDVSIFRQMVGSLQYLSFTRLDIQFAVNFASQFLYKPRQIHLQAVKCIFRYLKGTIRNGLQLYARSPLSLTIYSDSDWAGCTTTRRSTSGFYIFLGDNLISWAAKKQHTVARSSTEAEYRAPATATVEATWLQFLLRDLVIFLKTPMIAKCDNIGAIYLTHNLVYHSRSKHVALDYHFIHEKVKQGNLIVSHVHTSQQLADLFTKVLSSTRFQDLLNNLHVRSSPFD
uniref:Uncharacterized mitochondrial protein AtMg00810-like n=1 Tax=Nicotiana tabacum TaxID=4097 RepID=A0A1S3ZDA1_TOBAC|nr:PREDICTED: uncharacterized mitochondrial protein AtMg00810-like [Nicotiana tabacum]